MVKKKLLFRKSAKVFYVSREQRRGVRHPDDPPLRPHARSRGPHARPTANETRMQDAEDVQQQQHDSESARVRHKQLHSDFVSPQVTAEEDLEKGLHEAAMEWDALDADRSRSLDFREFSKLVREREVGVFTEEALLRHFQELDQDASGEITIAEYIVERIRDALVRSASRVLDLLERWDTDGSGEISQSEFVAAMRSYGFRASETTFQEVFNRWPTRRSAPRTAPPPTLPHAEAQRMPTEP
jgi:Ca2+-binding EF-hand superfamily protein